MLAFQNCEVVSEDQETITTQSVVTLGDNVIAINLYEFPESSASGAWNGQINEYRMDLDSGDMSLFKDGSKIKVCLEDSLKQDLIDFSEQTEICINRTERKDGQDVMCTMEYKYGDVVFNLEAEVQQFFNLNINGTNGCQIEVKFCNDADLEEFKKLRDAVFSTPEDSCE